MPQPPSTRVRLAIAATCAVASLACQSVSHSVVRIGPDAYVASASGGSGADAETQVRATAIDAADRYCQEQGRITQLEALVSTPTRPGSDEPSASVTFQCLDPAHPHVEPDGGPDLDLGP
jgi:hypothetical protein